MKTTMKAIIIALSFVSSGYCKSLPDKINALIIHEITNYEIAEAWLWFDVFSDKLGDEGYFSPKKIKALEPSQLASLKSLIKHASNKNNNKNLQGDHEKFVIVIKDNKGELFGLLRDPSQDIDMFTLVSVEMASKPKVSGRIDIRSNSTGDDNPVDEETCIYIPGFSESATGKAVRRLSMGS
jgi:hypothetical protein